MNVTPNFPAPQTPPRTPSASAQALSARVTTALERALPGVDAEKLMSTLDSLLGGRGRYALVGSTSLHLHAIEQPNFTQELPLPNDLDAVFDQRSSLKLECSNERELAELNLKRDPDFGAASGGKENAESKVASWLRYFDVSEKRQTNHNAHIGGSAAKKLKFGD